MLIFSSFVQRLAYDVRRLLSSDRGSKGKEEHCITPRTAAAWLRSHPEAAAKLAQLNLWDHQPPCAVAASHSACQIVQPDCRQHLFKLKGSSVSREWGYEMSIRRGRSALYELFCSSFVLAFCYRRNQKYTDDQLEVFYKYAAMAVKVQSKRDRRCLRLDWGKVHALMAAGEAPELKAIVDDKGWKTVNSTLVSRRQKLPLQH
jgi:hypothetical protein